MAAEEYGPPVTLKERVGRNRVWKVGIELEGAWIAKKPPAWDGSPTRLIRDGSLDPYADDLYKQGLVKSPRSEEGGQVGEVVSPPLQLSEVETWMRTMYPSECGHVRCSLHVHMSFNNALTYARLGDPRYPATIIEYMKRWAEKEGLPKTHPLWARLEGKSEYCQHVFDFTGQIQNTQKDFEKKRPGHRYTVINFPYQRTTTVECRLMTMFPDVEQSIRAVQEVIRVTNGFLLTTAGRTPKVKSEVKLDPGTVVEETRIYV